MTLGGQREGAPLKILLYQAEACAGSGQFELTKNVGRFAGCGAIRQNSAAAKVHGRWLLC
jgi:hypothetical protein